MNMWHLYIFVSYLKLKQTSELQDTFLSSIHIKTEKYGINRGQNIQILHTFNKIMKF